MTTSLFGLGSVDGGDMKSLHEMVGIYAC